MVPPSPIITGAAPAAVDLDTTMEPPDWTVVTLTGTGFQLDGDVSTWDAVDFRCRGTGDPGAPPRPGSGIDGYFQVGNVSNISFQMLAPTSPTACLVDIRLRRRAAAAPNPDAGVFTDWIPGVLVVGDPPLAMPRPLIGVPARPGDRLTITGENLLHVKWVRFGNVGAVEVAVQPPDVTDGAITVTVPDLGHAGLTAVNLFVVRPAGLTTGTASSGAGVINYLPLGAVHVEDYDPKEGTVDGGTTVRITGAGLDQVYAARVGAATAQLLFASYDDVIIATPPAPGGEPGAADIVLQVPDPEVDPNTRATLPPGTVFAEIVVGPFTYTPRATATPPTVAGFVPSSGPTTGGTVLSITGTDLDQVTEVRVGGLAATDLDATFGLIVCRTPPRATAGAQLVEVFYDGGRIVAPGLFEYRIIAPPVTEAECARRAWLTLPARELPLEDPGAGYVCVALDIGWPTVREVVNNAPDADGLDDRTSLFAGRVVTAHVIAGGMGGTRTPDDIARAFGPYCNPRVRPVLHWTVDSPETDYAERTLTLRASEFTAPIEGAFRDIHLAWVAPDPIVRAAVPRETQARPAYAGATGRRYDLTFDRRYPTGAGGAVAGQIVSPGDVDVFPLVRIFGPITGPSFTITAWPPDLPPITAAFVFRSAFRIDAGRFVDVDCRAHTAIADTGARVEAQIDWPRTTWPVALGGGVLNVLALAGTSTDHVTQAVAIWRDGYLAG